MPKSHSRNPLTFSYTFRHGEKRHLPHLDRQHGGLAIFTGISPSDGEADDTDANDEADADDAADDADADDAADDADADDEADDAGDTGSSRRNDSSRRSTGGRRLAPRLFDPYRSADALYISHRYRAGRVRRV